MTEKIYKVLYQSDSEIKDKIVNGINIIQAICNSKIRIYDIISIIRLDKNNELQM